MNIAREIPTINEIVFNAADRLRDRLENAPTAFRPNKFKKNQRVAFSFMGRRLTGRISNTMCRNGFCSYHIETPDGGWYREISESQITGLAR